MPQANSCSRRDVAQAAHGWFKLLDKLVTGTGTKFTVAKVFLDQTTWTPVINAAFFYTISMLEHWNTELAASHTSRLLWPTLKVNWVVWPVLQVS